MKNAFLKSSMLAFALVGFTSVASANTPLKATMKSMGTLFGGVATFVNTPASTNATADQVMDAIVQVRVIEFHLQTVHDRTDGEMIPDKIAALSGSERDVKIAEARNLLEQTSTEIANLESILDSVKNGATPRDLSQAKTSIQKLGGLIAKAHQLFK